MTDDPTYRCGWRYQRADDGFGLGHVVIRRGQWKWVMPTYAFDDISDEIFASEVQRAYSTTAFEQLEQDLNALAQQVFDELEQGNGLLSTGVPRDDVKAALYRWQTAKRDMQEEGT